MIQNIERRIERSLSERFLSNGTGESQFIDDSRPSAVLFVLGRCGGPGRRNGEPCLILNKRSNKVRQGGDLCFPGGGVSGMDRVTAKLLSLPFFPLDRWTYFEEVRRKAPGAVGPLSLMLAAGLREAFEEMRLNPLGAKFLGPIPRQRLSSFARIIHPMAVAVQYQTRFFPNWEVDKIVPVPIRELLDPGNYACYRLTFPPGFQAHFSTPASDYPCFLLPNRKDLVWGATYRILKTFLDIVFGFAPPDIATLPVVYGNLDLSYITGAGKSNSANRNRIKIT